MPSSYVGDEVRVGVTVIPSKIESKEKSREEKKEQIK
jgi:hypothetical protein